MARSGVCGAVGGVVLKSHVRAVANTPGLLGTATPLKKSATLSPEPEPDEAMTELIRNFVEPAQFYQVCVCVCVCE